MKKILLLAAAAAGVFGAQAEGFDDIFMVQQYHGTGVNMVIEDQVYENGSTIEIDDYDSTYGMAACDLIVTNISEEKSYQLEYGFVNVDPTADVAASDFDYGMFTICYNFGIHNSCTAPSSGEMQMPVDVEVEPGDEYLFQLHHEFFTKTDPYTVKFILRACKNGKPVEGLEYNITISFTHKTDPASVEGIGADSSEAEYYNLQGVRVAAPERGLFIKKQGGKACKVIL